MTSLFSFDHTRAWLYNSTVDVGTPKQNVICRLELLDDTGQWQTLFCWTCRKKKDERVLQMSQTVRAFAERIEILLAGGWAITPILSRGHRYLQVQHTPIGYTVCSVYLQTEALTHQKYTANLKRRSLDQLQAVPDNPRQLPTNISPKTDGQQWLVDNCYPGFLLAEHTDVMVGQLREKPDIATYIFLRIQQSTTGSAPAWRVLAPPAISDLRHQRQWRKCAQQLQAHFDLGWTLVDEGGSFRWQRGDEQGRAIARTKRHSYKDLRYWLCPADKPVPQLREQTVDTQILSIAQLMQEQPEAKAHQLLAADTHGDEALETIIGDPDILA